MRHGRSERSEAGVRNCRNEQGKVGVRVEVVVIWMPWCGCVFGGGATDGYSGDSSSA